MRIDDIDPRTVDAIEKIRAILREHDLWAGFVVVSPERVHWVYHFEPSWSCLHFNAKTGETRIRAKQADFATAEQHRAVTELTVGAIASTRDFGKKMYVDAGTLYDLLAQKFDIEHHYSDLRYERASEHEQENGDE